MGKQDRRTNYFSVLDESYEPESPMKNKDPSQANGTTVSYDAKESEHGSGGEDAVGGVYIGSPQHNANKAIKQAAKNRSGSTLRDNGGSIMESAVNTSQLSKPLGPDQLNMKNLSIASGNNRNPLGNGHYQNPYQRGQKTNEGIFPSSNAPRRGAASYGSGNAYGYRGSRNINRPSCTWMSPEAQTHQQYMVIRNSMRRQFKNSDISKWKIADYLAHHEAMIKSMANALARKAESEPITLSEPIEATAAEIQHKLAKFGLKRENPEQHNNIGSVLGEQTIWCKDWMDGKDEIAPWPSMAELKWEGDDRAKTGVGRYLPLPREEGPPGLSWNQLPVVDQYPMDQVALIPTLEDIYLPVDPHIEEDKEYLWSMELGAAIDDFLDS